jgi:hypothetical protein
MENASLTPLTINETNNPSLLAPGQMPHTAPALSASFAVMQDLKPGQMPRSTGATKLSQVAKEGGSKSKGRKYDVDAGLRKDIETCRQALELFLASRMRESER